jgi:hypothetical protein
MDPVSSEQGADAALHLVSVSFKEGQTNTGVISVKERHDEKELLVCILLIFGKGRAHNLTNYISGLTKCRFEGTNIAF